MSTLNTTQAASTGLSLSVVSQIACAMLLGVLIVFSTGFVEIEAAHNAAHDARHAFAFPCH